jgi:hypothetical protein
MGMIYEYKGARFKGDPAKVYLELAELEDRTPDGIVDMAMDPSTESHKNFDWNNDVAGPKWRRHQARQLMCSIVVYEEPEEDEQPQRVRAFENVTIAEDGQRGYVPREEIIRNPEYKAEVVAEVRESIDELVRKLDTFDDSPGVPVRKIARRISSAKELITG